MDFFYLYKDIKHQLSTGEIIKERIYISTLDLNGTLPPTFTRELKRSNVKIFRDLDGYENVMDEHNLHKESFPRGFFAV